MSRPAGRHCRRCRRTIGESFFCEDCDEEIVEYCAACHDERKHSHQPLEVDVPTRGGRVGGRDPAEADAVYNGSGIYD